MVTRLYQCLVTAVTPVCRWREVGLRAGQKKMKYEKKKYVFFKKNNKM